MKAHRLAKYFPILEGDEFDLLVDDIKKNGQLEPIVTVDGEILDGINRYRACTKLGIEPRCEKFKGDDPLAYVISLNIRRRHLDPSQRAMLATEMMPEIKSKIEKGSMDPRTDPGDHARLATTAAQMFSVSGVSVRRAQRVKEQAPDRVDDVIRGRATVREINDQISASKEKIRQAEVKKQDPNGAVVALDIMAYLNALERCISILPNKPPKNWTDNTISQARSYAKIIIKRLEEFTNE